MKAICNQIKSFLQDQQGVTSTEYAFLLGLIVLITFGAIVALGPKVLNMFENMYTKWQTA
ncbi:MAG: Flp family type IVb pilin [Phycisphaerae bacterium]|nr:Flp family type IVb pilin [Phycisphaerae bacterium]